MENAKWCDVLHKLSFNAFPFLKNFKNETQTYYILKARVFKCTFDLCLLFGKFYGEVVRMTFLAKLTL